MSTYTENFLGGAYWTRGRRSKDNLDQLAEISEEFNGILGNRLGQAWRIDEMAILLPSVHSAVSTCTELVEMEGVELFNRASDTVKTYPFMTTYSVQYFFLRTPHPFRIEAMAIDKAFRGMSPIHSSMWPGGVSPDSVTDLPIVHASFKCADGEDYEEAVDLLGEHAMHAMSCRSAYGRFSYWLLNSGMGKKVFLKPRQNLREGGGVVDLASAESSGERRARHDEARESGEAILDLPSQRRSSPGTAYLSERTRDFVISRREEDGSVA